MKSQNQSRISPFMSWYCKSSIGPAPAQRTSTATERTSRLDGSTTAQHMRVGYIYIGLPVGEFQKDSSGSVWWKRVDGSIQKVNPHPDSLFIEQYKVG